MSEVTVAPRVTRKSPTFEGLNHFKDLIYKKRTLNTTGHKSELNC